ncbi:hypothetical protein CD113_03075 [Staphylococcus simiae]|uniref:Uncharacterized protein n=1 Tax=Staphylococcus simiae CCM 7213 = CCUG 51256 TaxID=911238 RepID=G5JHH0_9STAP|nr:hypothetical protein SS7213T_04495 [Staphylococcus simiae CCM 7213 = CCUG 51256]PNZ14036.1 hypothetical protein CD113_03075 [Staphylococcus simiae]
MQKAKTFVILVVHFFYEEKVSASYAKGEDFCKSLIAMQQGASTQRISSRHSASHASWAIRACNN